MNNDELASLHTLLLDLRFMVNNPESIHKVYEQGDLDLIKLDIIDAFEVIKREMES